MTYSEHARAKTTNGGGSNLSDVDRSHYRSLSNTKTTDESTSVDGTEVSVDTADHEDDNTKSPKGAENTSSPNTTDAITDQEGAVQSKSVTSSPHSQGRGKLTSKHHQQNQSAP